MGDLLEFILITSDKRKKAIYFFLALLLSLIITAKIYFRMFGDPVDLSWPDTPKIMEFFLSGTFVICLMIFCFVFFGCYYFLDLLVYGFLLKQIDKFYYFLKYKISPIPTSQIRDELKAIPVFKRLGSWFFKSLKKGSFIELEKDGRIMPGIKYEQFLKRFKKLKQGKETIDIDLSYYPMGVAIQLLFIFNTVVIDNFSLCLIWIILINIAFVVFIIIQGFVYLVNIFVALKNDKIYMFLKNLKTETHYYPTDEP